MKKIFIFAITVMTMCTTFSCGNKTANTVTENDSVNVDSTTVVDSVNVDSVQTVVTDSTNV